MDIEVKLSKGSIESAIRQLKKYARTIDDKIAKANDMLISIGEDELEINLMSINNPDGNDLGDVTSVAIEENARLIWTGDQISFLEYGTGFVGQGTYKGKLLGGYTYGAGKSLQHNLKHEGEAYWKYDKDGTKIVTYGIPAQAPMLKTAEAIRKMTPVVYRETFSKGG